MKSTLKDTMQAAHLKGPNVTRGINKRVPGDVAPKVRPKGWRGVRKAKAEWGGSPVVSREILPEKTVCVQKCCGGSCPNSGGHKRWFISLIRKVKTKGEVL